MELEFAIDKAMVGVAFCTGYYSGIQDVFQVKSCIPFINKPLLICTFLDVGGVHGVMVTFTGNEYNDQNSNPRQDCISHSANTLRKNMNLTTPPPSYGVNCRAN